MQKVGNLAGWMSLNRKDVLIVTVWSIVMMLTIVKIFWLEYATSVRLQPYQIAFTLYDAPAAGLLDIILVFAASLVVPLFISTVERLFYGTIISIASSIIGGIIFVSLYIWYPLGMSFYWVFEWGWEWAVHFGILNVFRIAFPSLLAPCLLGVTFGFLLRSWIRH